MLSVRLLAFLCLSLSLLAGNEDITSVRLCENRTVEEADPRDVKCRPMNGSFGPEKPFSDGYLVVMSWNLNRGANWVEQLALFDDKTLPIPDILFLSESDRGCWRSGFHNVAQEFARKLKMNYAFGTEYLETSDGRYACEHGNAILSRYPIQDIDSFFYRSNGKAYLVGGALSENRLGGRSAVGAEVKIGNGTLYAYSTHLEAYWKDEGIRWDQAKQIVDRANNRSKTVIIGGDLNNFLYRVLGDASPVSLPFRISGYRDAHESNQHMTIEDPGDFRIDFIYFKGLKQVASGVGDKACYRVSDHLPIWANYSISDWTFR